MLCSSKTDDVSLNDDIWTGPKLQEDLHRYAVSGLPVFS